jgi:hypothetical protein
MIEAGATRLARTDIARAAEHTVNPRQVNAPAPRFIRRGRRRYLPSTE